MKALNAMLWSFGGILLMLGAWAEVAFAPQFIMAAHVLVVGAVSFILLGIIGDNLEGK